MQKSIDLGCIEPRNSPYALPLVLLGMKEVGLRVCADYHTVNKDMIPDQFPMPRIDGLVDMVRCTQPKVFTCFEGISPG